MSSHLDTVWKEEVTDWHLIKRPMPAPIPSVARMKYFRHKLAVSWFNVPTQNQIYFTINQPVGCLHESGLSQRTEWRKLGRRTAWLEKSAQEMVEDISNISDFSVSRPSIIQCLHRMLLLTRHFMCEEVQACTVWSTNDATEQPKGENVEEQNRF